MYCAHLSVIAGLSRLTLPTWEWLKQFHYCRPLSDKPLCAARRTRVAGRSPGKTANDRCQFRAANPLGPLSGSLRFARDDGGGAVHPPPDAVGTAGALVVFISCDYSGKTKRIYDAGAVTAKGLQSASMPKKYSPHA